MKTCPFCDSSNPDSARTCSNCGIVFSSWEDKAQPEKNRNAVGIQRKDEYLDRYSNGGLIAWSVVTMLLCLIPGIVGLVYAANINNSSSYDEQQHKASVATGWCLVGTILGILSIIIQVAAN